MHGAFIAVFLVSVLCSMVNADLVIEKYGEVDFVDMIFQHRYKRQTGGLSEQEILNIVNEHNRYRTLVTPTAPPVVWDPQMAINAQSWSDRCILGHSNTRGAAGENVFAAPFYRGSIGATATRFWYNEAFNPYCSCSSNACCGHYRQLVSPTTTRIGCGYTECSSITYAPRQRYLFVCQYWPHWQSGK